MKRRPTRFAIRAEDTPADLIAALAAADYSHLPEAGAAAQAIDARQRQDAKRLDPKDESAVAATSGDASKL